MAKTSMINRDIKRSKLVKKYASKRAELKKIVANPLPRPRDSTIVSDPEFGRLSGELWESLREESIQAMR